MVGQRGYQVNFSRALHRPWCRLFVEQRGWAVVLICAFIAKASPVTARAPPWNRCAPTMTSSWPLTPPGKPCARR
jgi:hypothetical protein